MGDNKLHIVMRTLNGETVSFTVDVPPTANAPRALDEVAPPANVDLIENISKRLPEMLANPTLIVIGRGIDPATLIGNMPKVNRVVAASNVINRADVGDIRVWPITGKEPHTRTPGGTTFMNDRDILVSPEVVTAYHGLEDTGSSVPQPPAIDPQLQEMLGVPTRAQIQQDLAREIAENIAHNTALIPEGGMTSFEIEVPQSPKITLPNLPPH